MPDELRPGLTLVVPSLYGGLDPQFACWDPENSAAVVDRGDEAQLLQKGRAVLRWHPAVIRGWAADTSADVRSGPTIGEEDMEDRGATAEREAFLEWHALAQQESDLPPWAKVALAHLARGATTWRVELPPSTPGRMHGLWRAQAKKSPVPRRALRELLGMPQLRHAPMVDETTEAATEGDEGSFLGSAVPLRYHLEGVRDHAERFGVALSLPQGLVGDLALAGGIHDLGKADPRFQLLLHGGDPVREAAASELLAKSYVQATDRIARDRARERSGYPRSMRHEILSVALVKESTALRERAHDWALVLHLVASHHGWCRPFAAPVVDPEPRMVSVDLEGANLTTTSAHGLERFDSAIPERFWMLTRHYGYWGLAWLEAILRLADHRESEREALREEAHDE
jgi:CRISPR-associated endonuclease/helicase Cas3